MKIPVAVFVALLPISLAQKPGSPPVPGTGKCEDPCMAKRNPVTGALLQCCALKEEDMETCGKYSTACALGEKEGCCCNGSCEQPTEDNGGCPDDCIPHNPGNGCEEDCCGLGPPNDDGTRVGYDLNHTFSET